MKCSLSKFNLTINLTLIFELVELQDIILLALKTIAHYKVSKIKIKIFRVTFLYNHYYFALDSFDAMRKNVISREVFFTVQLK